MGNSENLSLKELRETYLKAVAYAGGRGEIPPPPETEKERKKGRKRREKGKKERKRGRKRKKERKKRKRKKRIMLESNVICAMFFLFYCLVVTFSPCVCSFLLTI